VRVLALSAGALGLYACASVPPTAPPPPISQPRAYIPPPQPARPAPSPPRTAEAPPPGEFIGFADLAGWDQEDHAAALDAFRAACGVAKDPDWKEACLRARDLGPQDETISRAFLETNFRLKPLADQGLLTGYFAPQYPARTSPDDAFTAPVRARPADLVSGAPYADRTAIEQGPADGALAWMKPEDLFFLQIQGSGLLTFPDGARMKAAYAGDNGQPFVGIAAPMRDQGILADNATSADAIRAWLAAHRGPDADAVMRLDPRYVFFSLQPDDGRPPAGAAGVPLPPGRAIAVDPSRHAYGVLYWLDAEAPALTGAFAAYRRLAVALDTGAAIKGEVRADLYTGQGDAAGTEAGRVRHRLKMVEFEPVADPTASLASPPTPPAVAARLP
jgi:membrane-bound lytic murein transglycosylase A